MTQIRDQVFEQTLEAMLSRFPDLVGSAPGWPRFDRFKQVFSSMTASRISLEQAVTDTNFNATVIQICECISGLQALAITLGVDTRPVMQAIHRRDMGQTEVDLAPIVGELLEYQNPLKPASLEAVGA
jgi:hypothetical protein